MDARKIARFCTAVGAWLAGIALMSAWASAIAAEYIASFSGVAAPALTPRPVVELLNRNFNAILQEPETRALFFAQGYEPAGGSPEDFQRVLAKDVATWSDVIRTANIKFE